MSRCRFLLLLLARAAVGGDAVAAYPHGMGPIAVPRVSASRPATSAALAEAASGHRPSSLAHAMVSRATSTVPDDHLVASGRHEGRGQRAVASINSFYSANPEERPDWMLHYFFGGLALLTIIGCGYFVFTRISSDEEAAEEVREDAERGMSKSACSEHSNEHTDRTARDETKASACASEDSDAVDLERLLKLIAKRAAQQVGPKLAKAHQTQGHIRKCVQTFTRSAVEFVWHEALSIVSVLLKQAGAEEFMLLFNPWVPAAACIPPASVLLAGLLSPVVLNIALILHVVEVCIVLLPTLCMCCWAIYTDRYTLSLCAVPSIRSWVFVQTGLSATLIVAHSMCARNVIWGKRKILQKLNSMKDRVKEAGSGTEVNVDDMRELFLVFSVGIEHSLVVEDSLRRSVWRLIIGVGTMFWMATALWTFFLVVLYTFLPGVTVFHPALQADAGPLFCGAWATVFTARLTCALSMFLMSIHMITVIQFFADRCALHDSWAIFLLTQAKKIDKGALGLPVVEIFVKATFLRGQAGSIKAQIAASKNETATLENERDMLREKLNGVTTKILQCRTEAEVLKREFGLTTEEKKMEAAAAEATTMTAKVSRRESITCTDVAKAAALQESTVEELSDLYAKFLSAGKTLREHGFTALHHVHLSSEAEDDTFESRSGLALPQHTASGRSMSSTRSEAGTSGTRSGPLNIFRSHSQQKPDFANVGPDRT